MKGSSNQAACLYRIAKTHKLKNLEDITLANLNIRLIIDHIGTFLYKAA